MTLEHPDLGLVDRILEEHAADLGKDLAGYGNHARRVARFCLALHPDGAETPAKVAVAAAFHDLGIWTADTLAYLEPSADLARAWLERESRDAWIDEVCAMIDLHHKLRPVAGRPLVEAFRRADLVDVSLGSVRAGLPRSLVRDVRAALPNAGFHARLTRLALAWIPRHPLRPLPFLRW